MQLYTGEIMLESQRTIEFVEDSIHLIAIINQSNDSSFHFTFLFEKKVRNCRKYTSKRLNYNVKSAKKSQ